MQRGDANLARAREELFFAYVRDRLGDAYEIFATRPDEIVRIGLWLYDPLSKEIVFSDGFAIMPQPQTYPVGVGTIVKSFADIRARARGAMRDRGHDIRTF